MNIMLHAHSPRRRWTPSCAAAVDAVLQNRELVAMIFRGNTGPATFNALACVCRTWRTVCHEDEDVLRAAVAGSH